MLVLKAARLEEAVKPVCPVIGVQMTSPVTVDFAAEATAEQRAAAQAVVDAFDWSSDAQAAWELEKRRQEAIAWLDSDTKEARAVRSVLLVVMGEIRALKADTPLPTRSWTELKEYVANLIATGAGDPGYTPDGA